MIRLEYSKTKPRTISLPLSTRLLKAWLEVHPAKENQQAQLFPLTYGNLRKMIHRIGRRILNKRVSPHLLRHSSATFYANRLKNRYQLCNRYGWAMSSDMVDRYLDREGIFEEETVESVKADEITSANRQNKKLEEELSLVKESHSDLTTRYDELKQEIEALRSGEGLLPLFLELGKKQRQMSEVLRGLKGQKFDFVMPTDVAAMRGSKGQRLYARGIGKAGI